MRRELDLGSTGYGERWVAGRQIVCGIVCLVVYVLCDYVFDTKACL